MWSLLRKNREECRQFQQTLEGSTPAEALPPTLREHAATCPDCGAMAEEVLASRELLRALPASPAAAPMPWFAPRVMAAIAGRELQLRHSLDAWVAVPRLAARLTWACALALLLASTWLYERPRATPKPGAAATVESLFDPPPASSGTQDDILISQLEKAQ
jgi:hypothetical protein